MIHEHFFSDLQGKNNHFCKFHKINVNGDNCVVKGSEGVVKGIHIFVFFTENEKVTSRLCNAVFVCPSVRPFIHSFLFLFFSTCIIIAVGHVPRRSQRLANVGQSGRPPIHPYKRTSKIIQHTTVLFCTGSFIMISGHVYEMSIISMMKQLHVVYSVYNL